MKKIFLFGIICLLSLGCFTGCSLTKKAITTKTFSEKAENLGFIITDVKDQFADAEHVKEATVAASTEGWQVEFYVLITVDKAKEMFSKNKALFESEDKGIVFNSNAFNYDKYTQENEDHYMSLTRVDNTVLYVRVPVGQKDDVKKLVKSLGY